MNYAQNITFYPFFSIKAVVIQQNVSCFQIVSTMYWLYILVSLRMPRLQLSWLYVGHVRIIKQPSSFKTLWINATNRNREINYLAKISKSYALSDPPQWACDVSEDEHLMNLQSKLGYSIPIQTLYRWDGITDRSNIRMVKPTEMDDPITRCPRQTFKARGIKTGVLVKNYCPWRQQSPKLAIFSIKVTVKATRSLTFVSFERVLFVEYECQILSLFLLQFKSYGQG